MKADLSDITLVVDRSGSMQAIQSDAEGGINAFIQQQQRQPGEALLTLVQFDTAYDFVHCGVPVKQVPPFQLVPRGSTALLDAIGRAINETGARLRAMPEQERPGLVVFVVMTDGLENSSREFTKAQIKEMVEHQQANYSWQFVFLGANQDAFTEAGDMGMATAGAANFAMHKVAAAYSAAGSHVGRMRRATAAGEAVKNEFTPEERQQMQ